jgi:hypothetical protein
VTNPATSHRARIAGAGKGARRHPRAGATTVGDADGTLGLAFSRARRSTATVPTRLGSSTIFREGLFMLRSALCHVAVACALLLQALPADAQSGRRAAAESYARIIDYRLLVEQAATERARDLPPSDRDAFVDFVTREVDAEMTRFYATSAMVDLFEAEELRALASFAATPEGRSALAKLPALGAILNPIIERQITDAADAFQPPR